MEKTNFSGTPEIVEDNDYKRIVLWKDNNDVHYKTIYLKNQNQLKIIDTKGSENQVYFGSL